jgi:FkbM family methyltransferase
MYPNNNFGDGSIPTLVSLIRRFFHFLFIKREMVYLSRVSNGFSYRDSHGYVTLPPIRHTPQECRRLTHDYFLNSFKPSTGHVIIDVGSGMGTECLEFSRLVGKSGAVYAFEAHPKSAKICSQLISVNKLENCRLFNLALSNKGGHVYISDDPESLGINSIIRENLLDSAKLEVVSTRLDDIFEINELPKVDFIKMNIEGAEVLCLEGASNTLQKTMNVAISCHDFITEYEGGGNEMRTKDAVCRILLAHGFDIIPRQDHRPYIRDTVYASRRS